MDKSHITQIPDIEILPNILIDTSADDIKTKTHTKRKAANGSAHKRSQSVGVSLRSAYDPTPFPRRVSHPSPGYWATSGCISGREAGSH